MFYNIEINLDTKVPKHVVVFGKILDRQKNYSNSCIRHIYSHKNSKYILKLDCDPNNLTESEENLKCHSLKEFLLWEKISTTKDSKYFVPIEYFGGIVERTFIVQKKEKFIKSQIFDENIVNVVFELAEKYKLNDVCIEKQSNNDSSNNLWYFHNVGLLSYNTFKIFDYGL